MVHFMWQRLTQEFSYQILIILVEYGTMVVSAHGRRPPPRHWFLTPCARVAFRC